jgi:hypothetical protein
MRGGSRYFTTTAAKSLVSLLIFVFVPWAHCFLFLLFTYKRYCHAGHCKKQKSARAFAFTVMYTERYSEGGTQRSVLREGSLARAALWRAALA